MKNEEIIEFAKLKKKMYRMKIDKMKEVVRQRNEDKEGRLRNKSLTEKYRYDAYYSGN